MIASVALLSLCGIQAGRPSLQGMGKIDAAGSHMIVSPMGQIERPHAHGSHWLGTGLLPSFGQSQEGNSDEVEKKSTHHRGNAGPVAGVQALIEDDGGG